MAVKKTKIGVIKYNNTMANPKGNPENLIKKGRFKHLPTTETAEIGRKGAEKSNKVQKENRDWANIAQMFLTHKASKGNIKKIKKLYPNLDEEKIDIMATISSKLVSQAVNGDIILMEQPLMRRVIKRLNINPHIYWKKCYSLVRWRLAKYYLYFLFTIII